MRKTAFLFCILLLCCAACRKKGDAVVAQVYQYKLYASEVQAGMPRGLSQEDSLALVRDFIDSCQDADACKLIAYCFEDAGHPRRSIKEALSGKDIVILIGPEGDFSPEEARLALAAGFIPVHLGASRLRTETAAVTAAEAVYFHFL